MCIFLYNFMGYIRIKHITLKAAVEKYNELGELRKTAKFFGVSDSYISTLFNKNNIQYNKKVIYECDDDFFSLNNEESFYWAGFMAADGNVSKKSDIAINLSVKDIVHLEKFKKCIKSNAQILTSTSKSKPMIEGRLIKVLPKSQIKFRSRKMAEDLKRFGIVPAKTYIYS